MILLLKPEAGARAGEVIKLEEEAAAAAGLGCVSRGPEFSGLDPDSSGSGAEESSAGEARPEV
jgi:hypothetical protein